MCVTSCMLRMSSAALISTLGVDVKRVLSLCSSFTANLHQAALKLFQRQVSDSQQRLGPSFDL